MIVQFHVRDYHEGRGGNSLAHNDIYVAEYHREPTCCEVGFTRCSSQTGLVCCDEYVQCMLDQQDVPIAGSWA